MSPRIHCISLLRLHNKRAQNEWLKQQKCISSQFWRLQVQDQRCQQGLFLPRSLSLTWRRPSSPPVFTWSSLCVCVFSIRTPVILDWDSALWPHFNWVTSLKTLSTNIHSEILGVKTSTYELGGRGSAIQPITSTLLFTLLPGPHCPTWAFSGGKRFPFSQGSPCIQEHHTLPSVKFTEEGPLSGRSEREGRMPGSCWGLALKELRTELPHPPKLRSSLTSALEHLHASMGLMGVGTRRVATSQAFRGFLHTIPCYPIRQKRERGPSATLELKETNPQLLQANPEVSHAPLMNVGHPQD